MSTQSIEERVDTLEKQVKALQELPAKVDALASQISQLHGAMDVGFSALDTELRAEIRAGDEETRRQMREGDEETRRQLRRGDRKTRRYMRVLHEEVIGRIKLLGEAGWATPSKAAGPEDPPPAGE